MSKLSSLSKRLKEALHIRGMTQSKLSSLTGISSSMITNYIKGGYVPKQDNIYKLAKVLNVNEKWLQGYDVPMEPTAPVISSLSSNEESVSTRMRKAMNRCGLNQAYIVEKTGINKGALSSYISGRYQPKQDKIYLLAKCLKVSPEWLMGHDIPMEACISVSTQTSEYSAAINVIKELLDMDVEKLEKLSDVLRIVINLKRR